MTNQIQRKIGNDPSFVEKGIYKHEYDRNNHRSCDILHHQANDKQQKIGQDRKDFNPSAHDVAFEHLITYT